MVEHSSWLLCRLETKANSFGPEMRLSQFCQCPMRILPCHPGRLIVLTACPKACESILCKISSRTQAVHVWLGAIALNKRGPRRLDCPLQPGPFGGEVTKRFSAEPAVCHATTTHLKDPWPENTVKYSNSPVCRVELQAAAK